jgi:hypothetical protein
MSDRMVTLAIIVSRSEAIVVASMLDAAGIIVHVGGLHHAGVAVNSVSLGHYRVRVAEFQYDDASRIVAESFAHKEFVFSDGLQTAVIKLLLAWLGTSFAVLLLSVAKWGMSSPLVFAIPFLGMLGTPVNPQGRSDYFLSENVA